MSSAFYFDASALVKRYLHELGNAWVQNLIQPESNNAIVVAEITQVEVAAAFAARQRAPGGGSRARRNSNLALLRMHWVTEYRVIPFSLDILERAVNLTQSYRLRGYDAVQLATAIEIHSVFINSGLAGLTFVTADSDLLAAARAEGLAVDNPNLHP